MTRTSRVFPSRRLLGVFGLLALASLLSFWLGKGFAPAPQEVSTPTTRPAMTYYCAMHPRQQYSEPGKCPICAMDLIPLLEDHDPGPRALQMSEAAKQLADIETVEVERKLVEVQVSMVGKIEFDESKVKTITAVPSKPVIERTQRTRSVRVDRLGLRSFRTALAV